MEPTDFGKYVVLHIPNFNKFIKIVCFIPSFISLENALTNYFNAVRHKCGYY